MKKKNLKSLQLNKTPISKLDGAKGGMTLPPPPPPGLTDNCLTFIDTVCNIPFGDSHIVCETQQIECNLFTDGC
ncbi:MAG: hypothetical protein AAF611_07130 [Bacteroidota bacterium]